MDAYGNPLMLNPCLDPNAYAMNQFAAAATYPAYNYSTIAQEQPLIATIPIYVEDNTMDPCYNISSYGAPIKLQPNYYSAYPGAAAFQQQQQQIQQAAFQQFQAGCQQYQQQAQCTPVTPQIYSQWSQPQCPQQQQQQQQQCPQSQQQAQPQPQPQVQQQNYNQNKPVDQVKYETNYCPDNTPYCPENYCPEPTKPYKCKQPGVKAVRLPTIYKNLFDNNIRQGDELIAEYEEVLCPPDRQPSRQPRCYSRHRCHSNHRRGGGGGRGGHEVLAEYTEVLNYRPRHYSREIIHHDEYSDYDEYYDSHYDQRSCDQYYDSRSFDYSYIDHSHSYDHCDRYNDENKRNSRRTRSPGPRMQFVNTKDRSHPPPNDRSQSKPTVVNIDPKITRQAYNGTPVHHLKTPPPSAQHHFQNEQQQQPQYHKQEGKQIFNDNYRNSRTTPISNQRNLKTPTKPQNYRL